MEHDLTGLKHQTYVQESLNEVFRPGCACGWLGDRTSDYDEAVSHANEHNDQRS